ncbi:MAG TPA: hypothetical protein VKW04_21615 [Planctomycetota bacterium]|nr:hypothetical protein [Planctomycetota bacterium]
MNSEIFDRNLSRLLRPAALPADDARRSRARSEFLRAAGRTSGARSRGLAVAAAALLIGALVYGSTRPAPPTVPPSPPFLKRTQDPGSPFTTVQRSGGNDLVTGVLRSATSDRPGGRLRFEGRSTLPEGVCFQAVVGPTVPSLVKGRLEESGTGLQSVAASLEQGMFGMEWNSTGPAIVTIELKVPDSLQSMDLVQQLKIREADRSWSFVGYAWDDGLLSRLEPQLAELSDLVGELRSLVARVEASCASIDLFKASEKALIAVAQRVESRAQGFVTAGLYPASASQIAFTARDLATSMAIFTWTDGTFDGPKSYYTDHKRGKTFRGDPFEFDALRRYLDEAVVVMGREFDLWILADLRRKGLRPVLTEAVDRSAKRPGIAEFADRLKSGHPDPALIDAIRQIRQER